MTKALVITPTIGSKHLRECIDSVRGQTIETHHLLVIDGPEYELPVTNTITPEEVGDDPRISVAGVPFNVGKNGFYGHRIYAAFAHLHDFEYTLFLDEDNFYKPNHVRSLIQLIEERDYLFAHSKRDIHDKEGKFVVPDNCESLGLTPSIGGYHLVDTSSYCFKTDFLRKVSQIWHRGWGADRVFFEAMTKMTSINGRFGSTNQHTLCYRVEGNPGSVTADFFINGNKHV